jgi:hypothetical protein
VRRQGARLSREQSKEGEAIQGGMLGARRRVRTIYKSTTHTPNRILNVHS